MCSMLRWRILSSRLVSKMSALITFGPAPVSNTHIVRRIRDDSSSLNTEIWYFLVLEKGYFASLWEGQDVLTRLVRLPLVNIVGRSLHCLLRRFVNAGRKLHRFSILLRSLDIFGQRLLGGFPNSPCLGMVVVVCTDHYPSTLIR